MIIVNPHRRIGHLHIHNRVDPPPPPPPPSSLPSFEIYCTGYPPLCRILSNDLKGGSLCFPFPRPPWLFSAVWPALISSSSASSPSSSLANASPKSAKISAKPLSNSKQALTPPPAMTPPSPPTPIC